MPRYLLRMVMKSSPSLIAIWRHHVNPRNIALWRAYLGKSVLWTRWFWRRAKVHLRIPGQHPQSLPIGDASVRNLTVAFINLDHRVDRLQETSEELKRMGIGDATRIRAIKRKNGHLGASLSHAKALATCQKVDNPLSMVLEDDAKFLCTSGELFDLLSAFARDPALDVLLLGNNPWTKPIAVSGRFALTDDSSSAGGYVVKPHAIAPILRSHQKSAADLTRGLSPNTAALDQLWKSVQKRQLIFCVPRKLVFIQRESFSDIQNADHAWNIRETQGRRPMQ